MAHPVDHIRQYLDITPEMENSLRSIMTERHFRRGEKFEGIHALRNLAFYIRKGSTRTFYHHLGREHTYSFSFDDEFVTMPFSLLIHDPNAIVTVEFLENTELIFMPIDDTRKLIQSYGNEHMAVVASYVISTLFEQYQTIEERMLVLQSLSASERYSWLINRYPKILERATIMQIASYLGVTKETLYRIRSGKYGQSSQIASK